MTAPWQGDRYDQSGGPQTRWGEDVVGRVPRDLRGLVIDAGCGSGRVTEKLLEHAPHVRVLAIDGSSSMLATAEGRLARFGERVTLRVQDLREPLVVPERAAAVFSTGTFHWLSDHAALYRNLRGALVPGGLLVAQAGGHGSLDEVMRFIARTDEPLSKLNYYADVADTEVALNAGGFEPISVWLHPEPAEFESREAVATFLRDAALGPHLALVNEAERAGFIADIVAAMRAPRLEFVRLNIVAKARA